MALLGDPAHRETLYKLAGQLSRALNTSTNINTNRNDGAGALERRAGMNIVVNPPPSIRVDAAVVFPFFSPRGGPPDRPAAGRGVRPYPLVRMRETDTRPAFGAPASLEAALEGLPPDSKWRAAATASSDFGDEWLAVIPFYSIRDFRTVTCVLLAAAVSGGGAAGEAASGGGGGGCELRLGACVVSDLEEVMSEIEKLRAQVARLNAELTSAEAVAYHAAVG